MIIFLDERKSREKYFIKKPRVSYIVFHHHSFSSCLAPVLFDGMSYGMNQKEELGREVIFICDNENGNTTNPHHDSFEELMKKGDRE